MENIDRKKIGILLIICSMVIFMIVLAMYMIPNKSEPIIEKNTELSNEKITNLLRCIRKYLSSSENLENNSFTNDEMVYFALAYMEMDENYVQYVTYDEENEMIVANINKVVEAVEYIFDVKLLDYSQLSYKVEQDKVYAPSNMQGGDAQIYKYKRTDYNEQENVYIAYIDCLEFTGEMSDELFEPTQTEYDEDAVVCTLVIKYKVVENRKVLLAYKFTDNI